MEGQRAMRRCPAILHSRWRPVRDPLRVLLMLVLLLLPCCSF